MPLEWNSLWAAIRIPINKKDSGFRIERLCATADNSVVDSGAITFVALFQLNPKYRGSD